MALRASGTSLWREGLRGHGATGLRLRLASLLPAPWRPSSAFAAVCGGSSSLMASFGAAWLRKSPAPMPLRGVGAFPGFFLSFGAARRHGGAALSAGYWPFHRAKWVLVLWLPLRGAGSAAMAALAAGWVPGVLRPSGGAPGLLGSAALPPRPCMGAACAAPAPALMLRSLTFTSLLHVHSIFKARKRRIGASYRFLHKYVKSITENG